MKKVMQKKKSVDFFSIRRAGRRISRSFDRILQAMVCIELDKTILTETQRSINFCFIKMFCWFR